MRQPVAMGLGLSILSIKIRHSRVKGGVRRSLKCSRFRRLGAQNCYFKKQTEIFACVCACSRVGFFLANLLEFVFVKGIELRSFVSKSSNVQRDTRFNLCPSLRAAPGCVLACVGTHARMHACPPNIDIGNIRKEHGKTWETNLLAEEWKTASTSKPCMSRTMY